VSPFDYLGDLLVNAVMRLLGFVSRMILLILALLSVLFVSILFCGILVFWLLLPVIVTSLLINAIAQLFI
jgi:hypothetical protein